MFVRTCARACALHSTPRLSILSIILCLSFYSILLRLSVWLLFSRVIDRIDTCTIDSRHRIVFSITCPSERSLARVFDSSCSSLELLAPATLIRATVSPEINYESSWIRSEVSQRSACVNSARQPSLWLFFANLFKIESFCPICSSSPIFLFLALPSSLLHLFLVSLPTPESLRPYFSSLGGFLLSTLLSLPFLFSYLSVSALSFSISISNSSV